MDPEIKSSLERVTELAARNNTFLAYKECRKLLMLIRAAFPAPIVSDTHYANPELAVRFENTFPTWRMEVPRVDATSAPTFTPILRFYNALSVAEDQCLVFAHDMVGSLGQNASNLVRSNLREFLRSAGRSAMMNLTAITEERFIEVNGRVAYWGEGFLPAQNQQAAVVAIFNEVSDFSFHFILITGADHYNLTRSLLETFLDRMCFEKVDMIPMG